MTTKHIKKHIYGNSTKIAEINDTDFDIFFYVVGWESRFTEILNHLGSSFMPKNNYVCSFKQGNRKGYDVKKKREFIKDLKKHIGTTPELLEFEYSDFETFDEQINMIIFSKLDLKKRPLKIGFEISSCPRYHILYILGLCASKNYTAELSFFYSEGKYPDINEYDDFDDFFNSYGMKTRIIPYSNSIKKEGKTVFVFSLGFESNFIIDEITKYEPDFIIFLCANPGYAREYEVKVNDEIKRIVDFCELPDSMYARKDAVAGDAIDAWQQLEERIMVERKYAHIVHYAIGTKPHCLALSLNALVNDNIVVKYRIVKKYKELDVKSNGEFWRYDITNLRVV